MNEIRVNSFSHASQGGTRPPDGFSPARILKTRPEAAFHINSL